VLSRIHANAAVSMFECYHPKKAELLKKICVLGGNMERSLQEIQDAKEEEELQLRFYVPADVEIETEELGPMKTAFDKVCDDVGIITRRQMRQLLFDVFGIIPRTQEEKIELTHFIMERLEYSFVEFVTVAVNLKKQLINSQQQRLRESFDRFDTDGSGALGFLSSLGGCLGGFFLKQVWTKCTRYWCIWGCFRRIRRWYIYIHSSTIQLSPISTPLVQLLAPHASGVPFNCIPPWGTRGTA